MKITGKYRGCMPGIIHSPAAFAVAGKPFTVSAACRPDVSGEVPSALYLYLNGDDKIKLLPTDSLSAGKNEFEIYSAEIPGEKVNGGRIDYIIASEDVFEARTGRAEVPVLDLAKCPAQPPLRVSEIFGRPKGKNCTKYIEVVNPSDRDTDLYDYEFIFWEKKTSPEGEPTGRMPMADAPGTEILRPGEYAAIWGIRARNFANGKEIDTVAKFLKVFCADLIYRDSGLRPEDGRIVPVTYYRVNESGVKEEIAPDMPERGDVSCLFIVPRGKGADEAVFSMVLSTEYADWDTPTRRSSYWTASPEEPSKGVCIAHRAPATPGFPGAGQGRPDFCARKPLIIPVSPDSRCYIGDGDVDVAFAVVQLDPEMPVAEAYAEIKTGNGTEKIIAAEGDDGLWHAAVPAKTVRRLRRLEYGIGCTDGSVSVHTPADVSVEMLDNEGPEIIRSLPSEGYAYDAGNEQSVRVCYYDISGVDASRSSLEIDGCDVSDKAEWFEDCVVYSPDRARSAVGGHKLTVRLCDTIGNTTEKTVNYSVSDMKSPEIYVGEVHAHTADSDGSGRPSDAYEYARDVGGVGYFAVTDHSHYLLQGRYDDQKRVADENDVPGSFAALSGWEMTWNSTCGWWGHMNILNCGEIVNCIEKNSMPDMFGFLASHPEAIAMFNHPSYRWGNFDEYGHITPEADRALCLSEIKGPEYDETYALGLSKGWHTSPVSNEDNHNPNWTTATCMYGCVVAPALTRENVYDAFRARRTYTTSDRTMKIYYRVNGSWLGSRLDNPEKLCFDLRISTENAKGIGKVEIVAEDGIVVAVKDAGLRRALVWKPVLAPDFDYYYVRITGNGNYCVTAPVWIENRPQPEIAGIEYNAAMGDTDTAAVSVKVRNTTGAKIRDVRVGFFLSGGGFRLEDAEPFCTAYSGSLDCGAAVRVTRAVPEIPGMRRLTVFASALCGKRRIKSVKYVILSPVTVVSVLPGSGSIGKEAGFADNSFSYVTLYNSSTKDVSLDGGRLALSAKTGKIALPENVMPTDGITVRARESAVIWHRRDASLTAEDFNRAFGTSLEENVNLFITDTEILDVTRDGRFLELILNDEVVSRVKWNYGCECVGETGEGVEHRFVYRPCMTATSEHLSDGEPRPGFVDAEQARRRIQTAVKRRELKQAVKSGRKDENAEKRNAELALTGKESTAAAVGAAAAAAAITAAIAAFFRKNNK